VLRRTVNDTLDTYRFGDVAVDFVRFELLNGGEVVHVTPTELRLLSVFVRNRGRVLSRQEITDQVWGEGTAITPRVVDTHVANLRQKIEADPAEPVFLVGVRGVGYRFDG
jgi:DNA-binding response OmpR family regulator